MSVLYPLTLRRNCAHSRKRKCNPVLKFTLFFFIAGFSFIGVVAQELSKEEQERKEAELKKQEAAIMDAKFKANPGLKEKLEASKKLNQEPASLSPQEQQKIEEEEKARYLAKKALEKVVVQNGGVDYKVITNGSQVGYVVTNAGNVIYRHQINSSASLYERQVQAEKEGLYASNILRRNLNYPLNALQSEVNSLVSAPKVNNASRVNNNQRVTADYTFNGSGGTINLSGAANPYPAIITVSGVPAGAIMKEVNISGLNHTWADDVDIILQSPTGTNVVLISDVGGGGADFINQNYTLNDGAASSMGTTVPPSGTYKPSNVVGTIGPEPDNWVAPGPGVVSQPTPTLSSFGNGNHNGDWKLFVVDDAGGDQGNWGSWSITFTDPPVICFPISITGQPANATVCSGSNGSFTVVATPDGVNYNWQVNTGSGFVYLTNGGVYSGVTTATLNITGATFAMDGYQYRCVVTCTQGGLPEISNPATLTVLLSPSSPAVSPTSAAICPGGNQLIAVGGGAQTTFGGGPGVTIPGTGTAAAVGAPYPSTIAVAGLPAQSLVKSVSIAGLTHSFPDDIDIILKSPAGATVILMSDAGGADDVNGVTYTFDDAAASLLTDAAFNASGTYRPTNIGTGDNWPAPGPGTVNQATPALGSFGAGNNNGNWELYIYDDAGGDVGSISGWSITFEALGTGIFSPATELFTDAGLSTPYTAGSAVASVYAAPSATTTYGVTVNNGTCNSAPNNVTITVNQVPTITAQPGNGNACVGVVKTLSVTATGTALTYQWQVDMGSGFVNISSVTPTNPSGLIYTGQTNATLSINTVMATMNGYKYRCVVSGTCPPSLNSNEVTLSVNSLPAISVTKSDQCASTTLTASGADTYSWAPSAGLSGTTGATVTANPTANTIYTVTGTNTTTGCVNTNLVDVKFTPAIPIVAPTAPIICAGAVQQLSITSSSGSTAPNTTSSGVISLAVDNLLPPAISNLTVTGVTGSVQSMSVNFNITHTFDGDMIINLKAPNGNIFNLVNRRGGGGDNFINTIISSVSASPVSAGTAPFTGTYSADAANAVGIAPNQSNVTAFSSLYSTPNGTWSLIVTDHAGGDVGTLTSWSITLNYAIPDAGIWAPVTGLFTDAAGTTPYVAGTPATTVYASPAATTTYSVTVTNSSTETRTFSSGGTVTIPGVAPGSTSSGAGAPYPSPVAVSGLPANAVIKSVTVKGVRHSFPDDIDILLQSPAGTNVVLMSDVGGSTDATGQSYTFDDAAGSLMADGAPNATGTYRPTNFGSFDTYPAPVGSITQATPTLGSFTRDPNGTWNLYVADGFSGDIGLLSSWEITFTIPDATNCSSSPRTVTVTVESPIVYTTQPANRSACQNGTVTFTAAATGTITTTQWQVSTNGGTTWTDISGANTTSLTLTNVQPSQNGYRYRLVLSNAGCGPVNSTAATLTVNPLPIVSLVLSPPGQTQLRPGMQTTLTINSSVTIDSAYWYLNGILISAQKTANPSYVVDAHHLGTYTARVISTAGCVNTTSGVTFTALPTNQLFVYPNPTTGAFYVTYYMPNARTPVTLTVIDMMGRRMMERHDVTTGPYTRFDFSNAKLAAGVYIIEFRNSGGDRLAAGQLVVLRD